MDLKRKIPTISDYISDEWDEGDGLPGPAYRRKYGVDPSGPEAMGETQEQWDARMKRNNARYRAEMRRRRMKRTRVGQYVERLTGWHWAWEGLRNQAFIAIEREICIEDAKRIYGFEAHPDAVAVQVGYTVYGPLEVEVDPNGLRHPL